MNNRGLCIIKGFITFLPPLLGVYAWFTFVAVATAYRCVRSDALFLGALPAWQHNHTALN